MRVSPAAAPQMATDPEVANASVVDVFEPGLTKQEQRVKTSLAFFVMCTLVYMVAMCASGMMVDVLAVICFFLLAILFILDITPPLLGCTTLVVVGILGITMHVSVTDSARGVIAVVIFVFWLLVGLVLLVLTVRNIGGCRGNLRSDQWFVRSPALLCLGMDAVRKVPCGGCALKCCGVSWCIVHAFLLLFAVFASVVFIVSEDLCAVESYYGEYVNPHRAMSEGLVPPMEMGTDVNIDLGTLPQDFTGIWWIRWDSNPIPLYDKLNLEVLVSLAGTVNKSDTDTYPVQVASPNGWTRRWGFSNSLAGRIAMMVASDNDPAWPMNFDFINETHVFIHGGGNYVWTMDRVSEHEWLRTIERGEGYEAWHYTLTRLVTQDGQETSFFQRYLDQLSGVKLRVFNTGNRACRRCGSLPFGNNARCESECLGEW